MQRVVLPGTDLGLSVIGFGCWTIGGQWWGPVDDRQSVRAVRAALDQGIDWFDTAPLYGHGHADRVLVEALGPRLRQVVIATKVGVRLDGEHAESDLSAAHIAADCEASLRRLGLERIDLLQVHWPCERGTPLDETVGALERLREQGKVRAWGLCNYGAEALAEARRLGPVASLQTPYSLMRREFEGELRGAAEGLGVLAYETLCRGLLSRRHTREQRQYDEDDQRFWDERFSGPAFRHAARLVGDLGRAADKVGVTVPALAVGWALSRPGVSAAIVGARTAEQVAETARAAALLGRERLWSVVDRIAAAHGAPP